MRTCYFGKGVIQSEGEVIGLSLGADACSEHEWGIDALRTRLGMDRTKFGIEGTRVHLDPQDHRFLWEDDGVDALLAYSSINLKSVKKRILSFHNDKDELVTAWSNDAFGLRARGAMRPHLVMLKEALVTDKAALACTNIGMAMGLNLIVIDKYPEDDNKKWILIEKTLRDQKAALDATGIKALLEQHGKRFFSLGNRFLAKEGEPLRTWLNPYHQDIHYAGWFTFLELTQWATDEGPIIKPDHEKRMVRP